MAEQEKDQKTEDATPRRREESRESGQVGISNEIIAAMMLCTAMVCLTFGGGVLARGAGRLVVTMLEGLGPLGVANLTTIDAAELLKASLTSLMGPLLAIFLPVIVVGLLVGYGQVGFRVAPKAVAADISKVDPIKGFGRMFSARAVMRTVLAAAKVALITACMVILAWIQLDEIIRLGSSELGPLMVGLGRIAVRCTVGALVAILLLGFVDLVFQRRQHERDLRMTRQEVKEENRITEGDPHVKARVRQIQRDMATNRMMADVPKATVVITNPTHYAVALLYARESGDDREPAAPKVVAKGADHVAARIKEAAREAGVAHYEDVALARALHAQVDIGQEIPQTLYAAVAEVLAYVYRLQGVKVPA